MWLMTQIGFFSIVDKEDAWDDDLLTIRARCKSDLLALRALYLPEASPIELSPNNDYAYRVRALREAVARAASSLVIDIDYPNFKQRVSERQGGMRTKYYHHVWDNLYQLQRDPESAEWLDEGWWRFATGGAMPAEHEEVTVLEVCFEGGSIKLKASYTAGQWQFWLSNQEDVLIDILNGEDQKDLFSFKKPALKVNGWLEATTLLDQYPFWKEGYPVAIHPWFAKRVLLLREEA